MVSRMGRLTTHVLDTALGKPAAGLTIELYRLGGREEKLTELQTNSDGRADRALMQPAAVTRRNR